MTSPGTVEPSSTASDAEHAHELFYGDLGLCGCSTPEQAYELIRQLLALTPFYANPDAVTTLLGNGGIAHVVLSLLDKADLIEHGSVLTGAWATTKGSYFARVLPGLSWEQVDDAGFPHDGAGTHTPACWQ